MKTLNSLYYYDDDRVLELFGESKHSQGNIQRFDKNLIISDSSVDIKLISIPVVEKKYIEAVVKDAIRKVSINSEGVIIDYYIQDKSKEFYEVVVFVVCKTIVDRLKAEKYNIYTSFHLIKMLQFEKKLPGECEIFVSCRDALFCYIIKNNKFYKRRICNAEEKENSSGLFHIDFNNINNDSILMPYNNSHLKRSCSSLYNFSDAKKYRYILLFLLLSLPVVVFLGICLYNNNKMLNQKENYRLELSLEVEKEENLSSNRQEINRINSLLADRSNIKQLFSDLYKAGNNNIQINRLTYNDNNFRISGVCENDQELEQGINGLNWNKSSVSFTRRNGVIFFIIEGTY